MNINAALAEAELAIKNAQEVRQYHRRRTDRGNQQREDDLRLALERVKGAMKPLRSEIGRYPHIGFVTATMEAKQNEVRQMSKLLQKERRKLWKMLERNK